MAAREVHHDDTQLAVQVFAYYFFEVLRKTSHRVFSLLLREKIPLINQPPIERCSTF